MVPQEFCFGGRRPGVDGEPAQTTHVQRKRAVAGVRRLVRDWYGGADPAGTWNMLDGDVWDEAGDCVSLTPTRANRSRCSAWFAGKCIASVDGVCEVGSLRSDHPFRGGRPGAQLPAFASVKASEACDAVTLCEFAEKYL